MQKKKRGRPPREPRGSFSAVDGAIETELPIDEPWRERCAARLLQLGRTQGELADHIGCAQSSVSAALGGNRSTSNYADAISMALGVKLPLEARAILITRRAMATMPDAIEAQIAALELTFAPPPRALSLVRDVRLDDDDRN